MSKGRILIVEDELIIGEDLRMCLEERGYEIIGLIASPERAILKCREKLPDLILMDVHLSGDTNGIEAARLIKAEFGIPVVYLTGCPGNWFPIGTYSQETDPYVKKPFSEQELCAVIETALKNRGRNS